MSDHLARQLNEDRALRDAARAVVDADIAHLKNDLSERGIGGRVTDRLTVGAVDIFEDAVEATEDNRGALVTLIAAVVVWFARTPLMDLFSDRSDGEMQEQDQDEASDRTD